MNTSGDAAEQIVRLSLEGFEVAARLSGAAAKNIAILLVSVLKEEQKTKGKARLTNMIKSGKELKVFSLQSKDLKKFTQEAKRYGVLYCVLKDKESKDPTATIDVISRAEDASKIQRIVERFELGKVDKATIIKDAKEALDKKDNGKSEKTKLEIIVDDALKSNKDQNVDNFSKNVVNPTTALTGEDLPLRPNSEKADSKSSGYIKDKKQRPSVKKKLEAYKQKLEKSKSYARNKGRNLIKNKSQKKGRTR